MEVSPGEVRDLYNEGLPVSEIARRLKISRASVNHKLREYELDKRESDLDNRERELDIKEADLDARKKEIDKIPELEEKAHALQSEVHLRKSELENLTKKKDELEESIRSKEEVLEEIKEHEKRREEKANQLSELSNRVDLQRRAAKELDETQKQLHDTQKQVETENLTRIRIKDEIDINRNINSKLVKDNLHLEEETKVKKKAIYKIEQSFYGFAEATKQIALFMPAGSDTKTKTHEDLRKKVLRGMEITAKEANIIKPHSESDLQVLLRDSSILNDFALEYQPTKTSTEAHDPTELLKSFLNSKRKR